MARTPFAAQVRAALLGPCGVARGTTIVVGVSGGPDSTALLLALAAIAARSTRSGSVSPVAVHVHHHLRGAEADQDARFVGRLAARLGLPFERCDVHPAKERGSRAAAARRLRYQALADAARRHGAGVVAVAHHAEDQLETMLMALGRGAGLDGLRGLAWRRSIADMVGESAGPAIEAIAVVRPLLERSKSECEALCRMCRVRPRVDRGNLDRSAVRGRLRRDVLPAIDALWPGAAGRATATAAILDSARWAMEQVAPKVHDGSETSSRFLRRELLAVPSAIAGFALRCAALAMRPACGDLLDAKQVAAAVALVVAPRSGTSIDWPGGLVLRVGREFVSIAERSEPVRRRGPR